MGISLTQEELALRLHVTRQTVISLEKGRYNPFILVAAKTARLFHATIESVLLFDDEELR